jgi:hypothetical protein
MFLILHIVWLVLWLGVTVFMLLPSSQAGHPPVMVFWFYPVGYGIAGHVLLLALAYLKRLSDKVAARSENLPRTWPWPVWIAVLLLALGVVSGLFALAFAVFAMFVPGGVWSPFVLAYTLAALLLQGAGLFGIVLRKPWGRLYVSALLGVTAAVGLVGLLGHFVSPTGRVGAGSVFKVAVTSMGLLVLAAWFFWSATVKGFFGVGGRATPPHPGTDAQRKPVTNAPGKR